MRRSRVEMRPARCGRHRGGTRATPRSSRRAATFINRPFAVHHDLGNQTSMRTLATLAAFIALGPAQAQPRAPIEGQWRNPVGSAIIAIEPCGAVLCGKVVWASERGQREASKGAPQVVGATVLTNVRPADDRWTGSLFITDDNVRVSARLQLIGERQLRLTGCALAGLICRSQIWTRHDGPLPAS